MTETWKGDEPNKSVMAISYEKVANILAAQEPRQKAVGAEVVVAVARGGITPASMVATNLALPMLIISVTRGVAEVRWMCPPDEAMKNRLASGEKIKALVVDDILSSGNSMRKAREFLEAEGFATFVNVIFYDEKCGFVPEVGELAHRYVKFPWERREDTPGSKVARGAGSGETFHFEDESEFYGYSLEGIFTKESNDDFSVSDMTYAMNQRDIGEKNEKAPSVPTESRGDYVLLSSRPDSDSERLRAWADDCGLEGVLVRCRDAARWDSGLIGAVGSKIEAIERMGVSRYFESDLRQAVEIAKALPAIDVIWWRPNDMSVRIAAGAF